MRRGTRSLISVPTRKMVRRLFFGGLESLSLRFAVCHSVLGTLPHIKELPMGPEVVPFRIETLQHQLGELAPRISSTRWLEIVAEGWNCGSLVDRTQSFAKKLINKLDWWDNKAALNRLPKFHKEIDGQTVRFSNIRSHNETAFPVVLTHGWFRSFHRVLRYHPFTERSCVIWRECGGRLPSGHSLIYRICLFIAGEGARLERG